MQSAAEHAVRLPEYGVSEVGFEPEQLKQVESIVEVLREVLTKEGVSQWLDGPNFHLRGCTPLQIMTKDPNGIADVRAAAEALVDGGFS